MTEFQIDALHVLAQHPGIKAGGIAMFLWPDNDMHKRQSNAGAYGGSRRGAGAWRCAGGHIAKLERKGWVTSNHDGYLFCYLPSKESVRLKVFGGTNYGLTQKGLDLLLPYYEKCKLCGQHVLNGDVIVHKAVDLRLMAMGHTEECPWAIELNAIIADRKARQDE